MNNKKSLFTSLFVLLSLTVFLPSNGVNGHGMLLDPPARSSVWRVFPGPVPNYNDNGINCGGRGVSKFISIST